MNGKIKYFNGITGKIIGEDGNIYFVHRSDLNDLRQRFTKDREVTFDIQIKEQGKKYDKAINVSYIRKTL